MRPGSLDISIYQGDDFILTCRPRPKNSDGTLGNPQDLTSWTGKSDIKTAEGGTLIASFTVTIPPQVDGSNNPLPGFGTFTLSLAHDVTTSLTPTTGVGDPVWDVELTDPTGIRRTYLKGKVTIEAEVTTEV